jgi:hypothetical protein
VGGLRQGGSGGQVCGTHKEKRDEYIILVHLKDRGHLEDLDVCGKIQGIQMSLKVMELCGLESLGLGVGQVAGCFENGNEPMDAIKFNKLLD